MAKIASSPAHFRVTLHNFGRHIEGTWMTLSGGNGSSEIRRYRPGGDPEEVVSGGPQTRDDMTVSREWIPGRDPDLYRWADRHRGRARGTVIVQGLDQEYNKHGSPLTYTDAVLMSAARPDVDSNAGADVARIELVLAVSGKVA